MDKDTSFKRRLSAIVAADIAGYSRLMGQDEAATVRDLKGHQAVILPLVGRHGGRIIDTAGDRMRDRDPARHGGAQRGGARASPNAVPHWYQPRGRASRRGPDLR